MYVIPASPMAKIFQTRKFEKEGRMVSWQQLCLEDPTLITEQTPFDIFVDRPSGGLKFTYNVPKDVKNIHGSDEQAIVSWLTGGPEGLMTPETDMYGIVMFNQDFDSMRVLNRITELSMQKQTASAEQQESIDGEIAKLQEMSTKSIGAADQKAREQADEKVKRVLRTVFSNMQKQATHNKDQGIAPPTPSDSEYLAMTVLQAELGKMTKTAQERREKVQEMYDALNL